MGNVDGLDPNEGVSDRSADHHGTVDQGRLEAMESNGPPDHDAVGDEGSGGRSPSVAASPDEDRDQMLNEEETVAVEADQQELTQVFGSKIDAHERQVKQALQEGMEHEGGDGQLQPVNGIGNHRFPVVYSNGHDVVHGVNIAGLKEDEDVNQDVNDHLNHPDHSESTEGPEVRSKPSVPTIDTGRGNGHGIHVVKNKHDLDSQVPVDEEFANGAADVQSTDDTEPGVITHKGRSIVLAEVVREPDVMEPTLSRAVLQSEETEIQKRDVKAVARSVSNVDKVIPKFNEPSQDSILEKKRDSKTNGIVSDHSSERTLSDSDTVEGSSIRESPSKENGIKSENEGGVGPPSPLEDAPKWMNSGVITSQDEGDTFTSVQKYWAGRTGSEFLLVEGKRSPSFGSSESIGFPSFRNGEGRRSPSPFSLSKSGDGGVQSSPSLVSLDCRRTMEGKSEEWTVPSFADIHHDGSSSSSAHVGFDLEKVVHEQNTHDLFCPVCGSDVTERIVLRKRKRTLVPDDHGRVSKATVRQPGGLVDDQTPQVDDSNDETWGCLACLSFFIRRGGGGKGRVSESLGPGAEEPVEAEQERVRCLPSLFRWNHETSKPELQVHLLGDTARKEVITEPPSVNAGRADVPSDDDEVSCFSYFQRSKNSEIQDEAPSIIKQAEGVGEHGESSDKNQEAVIELLDGIGVSQQREIEQEKCDCLPFFSFRSESSFSVSTVTDTGGSSSEFHPVEDLPEGGTPESLPASVPAFRWGTSSKYDLTPSPGNFSSHQEITSGIDRPDQATTSLAQEPQALEDSSEKISSNCLPDLLPAFSWGAIPVYTHPPLETDESAEREQDEEPTAVSPFASVTQEPRALEDSSEKISSNCLPDLLPAFSWGPIPVYIHPPLDTDESAEREQDEEPSAVSPFASVTQEPQALEDSSAEQSFNCLPDLLPAFSWGPIPVYTHPPLDTDESTEREQGEEPAAVSPFSSVTQVPRTPGVVEEKGTYNCLPELLTFSWRPIPDNNAEIQSTPQTTTGRIDEVLVDKNEDLTSAHLKEEATESGTCACLPILLPAFHWGRTRTTFQNGLQEHLLPRDPPAAGPVQLDQASAHPMQTTEIIPDPGGQQLVVPPARPDVGGKTHIKEHEDFHIEGFVSHQKVNTNGEASEKPADVGSVNNQQSNYHFAVDITDGHVSSSFEKIKPELPPINISHSDALLPSSSLSAGTSDEAERPSVDCNPVIEGHLYEIENIAKELADHLVENDVAASSDAVSQPAEEIVEEQRKNEHLSCNCFPVSLPSVRWWRPSIDSTVGEGLQEHLLDESNSADVFLSTKETHVKLHRGQPLVDETMEKCNCLPSFTKFSLYDVFRDHHVPTELRLPGTKGDESTTPLLGRPDTAVEIDHTETLVAVQGATSAQAAAEAIAIAQGQSSSGGDPASSEYLKSIVHGGLDVTLVSLGVVASGAGGDAKTVTVLALGLANLLFGLVKHFNTLLSLYYNNRTQFQQEVGQGFIQGCLSSFSYLFFGALSPITYGFSFRGSKSKHYKYAATCLVALVSIVLLGAASARVKSKSAVRVISVLLVTGFLATVAGYETGNLVAELLEYFGFVSV